jgi:hypothetical protein
MMRSALLLVVALLGGADRLAAQEAVEMRGITPSIKLEETVYGHMDMAEVNGKYKMRATEVTFAPGAYLGVHHLMLALGFDMYFPANLHSLKEGM